MSADKSIPKDVSGFPIKHQLTNSIPSSQCVVCHVHPGTTVTNSYFGTIWWDNESDGEYFYPKKARHPSADEEAVDLMANPEAANVKGLWSDPKFLQASSELNPKLSRVQLADFHGHGWLFRYVWKHDSHGNLLDRHDHVIADNRYKWRRAVKLQDIHNEYGMQCADCHFIGDAHGNGKLYDEVRGPIQIRCEDCHGTYSKIYDLRRHRKRRNRRARQLPYRFELEEDTVRTAISSQPRGGRRDRGRAAVNDGQGPSLAHTATCADRQSRVEGMEERLGGRGLCAHDPEGR